MEIKLTEGELINGYEVCTEDDLEDLKEKAIMETKSGTTD